MDMNILNWARITESQENINEVKYDMYGRPYPDEGRPIDGIETDTGGDMSDQGNSFTAQDFLNNGEEVDMSDLKSWRCPSCGREFGDDDYETVKNGLCPDCDVELDSIEPEEDDEDDEEDDIQDPVDDENEEEFDDDGESLDEAINRIMNEDGMGDIQGVKENLDKSVNVDNPIGFEDGKSEPGDPISDEDVNDIVNRLRMSFKNGQLTQDDITGILNILNKDVVDPNPDVSEEEPV